MEEDIHEVEISIENAKKLVARKKLVLALENNKAFQELVLKGYFEQEAVRLTHLMSDPSLAPEHQPKVYQDLMSIGGFKRYLHTIVMMGTMAENQIAADEETLDALREEAGE